MQKIKYNSQAWQLAKKYAHSVAYWGDMMDFVMDYYDYQLYREQCKAAFEEPLEGHVSPNGATVFFCIRYDMIEED